MHLDANSAYVRATVTNLSATNIAMMAKQLVEVSKGENETVFLVKPRVERTENIIFDVAPKYIWMPEQG